MTKSINEKCKRRVNVAKVSKRIKLKGFTTTKITIKINSIVGTSLMYLKYLEVYFDGSIISFFEQLQDTYDKPIK